MYQRVRLMLALVSVMGLSLILLAACDNGNQSGAVATSTVGPSPTVSATVGQLVTTAKGSYTDISPQQLNAMLAHKDFFLVDVHVPHQGRLPNLDARIAYDKIADNLNLLPTDMNARIVLTCRSGRMSTIASNTLADLGYTHVFNLVGGFDGWQAAGYPLLPEATPKLQ